MEKKHWTTQSGAILFHPGFPRGIESIEKVLNCEIGLKTLNEYWI